MGASPKTVLVRTFLRYLQRNSSAPLIKRLQNVSYAIYRATNNPNYHFSINGEQRVLKIIADYFGDKIIFDVGANVGHWSLLAADAIREDGEIYSFEPCKQTFGMLENKTSATPFIKCFNLGLSNKSESKQLLVSKSISEKSSVEKYAVGSLHKKIIDYQEESQDFLRGDTFCQNNSITKIAFLKIDAEGHDYKIIEGFEGMLGEGSIDVIQFEYNRLNIYTKSLLNDFYELLNPPSSPDAFCIGRIYPKSVRFKKYDPLDENFVDGNFIAVQRSLGPLIRKLECDVITYGELSEEV